MLCDKIYQILDILNMLFDSSTSIDFDVPRSIAEDLRIAFLQSTLFWQVSCAKSKTKACTEISAWTANI